MDKIQILNANNLLYQKFAVSVRKVKLAADLRHHCISRHHNQWMRNLYTSGTANSVGKK